MSIKGIEQEAVSQAGVRRMPSGQDGILYSMHSSQITRSAGADTFFLAPLGEEFHQFWRGKSRLLPVGENQGFLVSVSQSMVSEWRHLLAALGVNNI